MAGEVDGSCGIVMLKVAADLFSVAVGFSPSCGMTLDGDGFCRASVRSDYAHVTAASRDMLRNVLCTGKSYVVPENRSGDVLGMYDVIHQWFSIYRRKYHPS